jgi:2-dehydro-3-deoxyphosphogluconate aldolase/(4S)-4-hydroxy-2-oxoglutarate aldolase
MRVDKTYDTIRESRVIGILRGIDQSEAETVATALADGGVKAVEVTADTEGHLEMITTLAESFSDTDVTVGCGTVLDTETAQRAINAGAEFILAPNTAPNVIQFCNEASVVSIPGVQTPTEAVTALDAGADMLKLFPASTVGPGHVGALRGPLGDIPVVPTGGVSTDNVNAYFEAGATAVGVGSALVDPSGPEPIDPEDVKRRATEILNSITVV